MVEICSKSLVRAIGKLLLKGNEKWPLFVNKQLFWWSASITLNNNNAVLTDFQAYFSLHTLSHTSVSLTGCVSIVFSVLINLTHMTTRLRVGSLLLYIHLYVFSSLFFV